MSVRFNEQRKRWMVDVEFEHADGTRERVRKTSPVNTKRGALEYEGKLRVSLNTRAKEKVVPTLDDFFDEFVDKHVRVHNRHHELVMKRSMFRAHVSGELGRFRLDQIGPLQIAAYTASRLAAGLKAKSVNNHLALISRMLRCAAEWDLIEEPRTTRRLPVPASPFDFLTFDEADRLLAKVAPEWYARVLVALRTGLRQGELIGLRWQDVDLVKRRLVVRRSVVRNRVGPPKNGQERVVPLAHDAVAALKEQRAATAMRSELVWANRAHHHLIADSTVPPLALACRLAGLREVGWHVLRHTFASHLVMRGVPLKAVQELMGHKGLAMTLRYAHLAPEVKEQAVDLLASGNLTATVPARVRK